MGEATTAQLGGRLALGPLPKPQAERAQAQAHLGCLEQRRERALEAREAHRHYGTALNQKSAGIGIGRAFRLDGR